MIDRSWGTHLRHWREFPNTFRLLDRLSSDDTEFTSWHAGGCRVLACAVKACLTRLRYPGDLSKNPRLERKPGRSRNPQSQSAVWHKRTDVNHALRQTRRPYRG